MIESNSSDDFLNDLAKRVAKIILPEVLNEIANKHLSESEDRTLEADEAAAHIKISRVTLYRMCAENLLPHMKIGGKGSRRGKLLFSSNALDKWKRDQLSANYQPEGARK
ncbi:MULTISPECIES: helix-turn-helix domain-containing protein [unclassified Paenibacillus]|uniref:helix-turn-helix domain-containing protein n=1 Tax=unclassified Paenibacillus TaxID=185978 RepID=UPI0009A5F288|nr:MULTISPECIES: helix-turn-helix domain-containing protein [unclassified Paenibacillus]SLJ92780.1 Helix-turn-helix domain-containing protein [Paenibacillus sp. RU5A]SOC58502.1 Helix-turn-helix domain-containing protein [Paenibacillus sp. RU26A]SOC67554.1 Helix-turn-helix domain-containing protein [Paenibacillus sp. RU5M]